MAARPAVSREINSLLLRYTLIYLTLLPSQYLAQRAFAQIGQAVDVPNKIVQSLVKMLESEEKKDGDDEVHELSAKNFGAQEIGLTQHGKPGLYVYLGDDNWCSMTGNCWVWIYAKKGDHYQQLLEADGVQGIEPQKTFTKSYRDITTRTHESNTQSSLALYKFDGKRYRLAACFFRTYVRAEDKPLIESVKCRDQ